MQGDGNLVMLRGLAFGEQKAVIWDSETWGEHKEGYRPAVHDDWRVVISPNGVCIWKPYIPLPRVTIF